MKKLTLLVVLVSFSINSQSVKDAYTEFSLMLNYPKSHTISLNTIDYRHWDYHSIDYRDFASNYSADAISDATTTGSRFISDFQPGKILGHTKDRLLRYDAFNDQMELKNTENEIGIINKKTINGVHFKNGSTYIVSNYSLGERKMTGYLKVIFSGSNSSLLKKEVIKYVFEKKAESGYHNDIPAAFKKGTPVYFIADHNGGINSFTNKKEFLELFPTKRKTLEHFITTNKIKFSKEASLVELVRHVDSKN